MRSGLAEMRWGDGQSPNATVVDRRQAEEIRAFGSGIEAPGIDVFFAIATSGEDAQSRAILARAGV